MSTETKRIIIIDDDTIVTSVLEKALTNADEHFEFSVDIFDSAEDGIGAIKINHYDLMLLDYQMPGMDGVTLLETLDKACIPPFIFFTSSNDPEVISNVNSKGAINYIVKPINPAHIVPAVITALGRSKDIMDLERKNVNLNIKVESSTEFNVAVGILMAKHVISKESAVSLLISHSRSNRMRTIDLVNDIIHSAQRDGEMNTSLIKHVSSKKSGSTVSHIRSRKNNSLKSG